MKNMQQRKYANSNVNACNYCILPLFNIDNYSDLSDYSKNTVKNMKFQTYIQQVSIKKPEELKLNEEKKIRKSTPTIPFFPTFSRMSKISKSSICNKEEKGEILPKCRLIPLIVNKENPFGKKSKSIFQYLKNIDSPQGSFDKNRIKNSSKYERANKSISLDQEMNQELKEIGKVNLIKD